ncbi:MAG: T9SS type A sorting domain-containing protein [Bacteroidia bacterium]|nr:T9SS type A sorting domain-containing protein [Bacteroidia bacterium]
MLEVPSPAFNQWQSLGGGTATPLPTLTNPLSVSYTASGRKTLVVRVAGIDYSFEEFLAVLYTGTALAPTILPGGPFCQGDVPTFSGSTGTSHQWEHISPSLIVTPGPDASSWTFPLTEVGTHLLRYRRLEGCCWSPWGEIQFPVQVCPPLFSSLPLLEARGDAGAIRLNWFFPETAGIERYQVWKGETPSSLQLIHTAERETLSWVDISVKRGAEYCYQVRGVTRSGLEVHRTGLVYVRLAVDPSFQVAIYPNPAQDVVFLTLTLPEPGNVNLTFLGMKGEIVAQKEETLSAGTYTYSFSTRDWALGIYPVQVTFAGQLWVGKLVHE